MADGFGEVVEKLRRSTVQVKAHRNGSGSGVIWSQDGRIVTNAHVVEGVGDSAGIEVEIWNGRSFPGKIVDRDRRRDLAVLQVGASGLAAVTPGDSNTLRVGELVIAVGNPLGFTGAASTGVVHRVTGGDRSYVVSQLRLAPGNSGGPLANARGEVVGINTMISGGLAFAISSHSLTRFLNSHASTRRGGLGVVVRPVLMGRSRPQLGFVVLEVIPDSPADRSSIMQGDVLVGTEGRLFHSVDDLEEAIDACSNGVMKLQFLRGGSENIRTASIRMVHASARAA